MYINPSFFVLARPPCLVIWDYKRHTQFELDPDYSARLTQLIATPEQLDPCNSMDTQFLAAGLFTPIQQVPTPWGWDELSKIFHIGTKNIPCEYMPQDINEWSQHYLAHCKEVMAAAPPPPRCTFDGPELIPLPDPALSVARAAGLATTLIQRKTCRSFTPRAVSLVDVGTLLYLTLGYLHERADDDDPAIAEGFAARRSSPSGGGLNACDGYLYVRNVSGLAPGVYFYHPDRHALQLVAPLLDAPLGQLLAGQHFINPLPVGLFITCRFDKLWWKYEHSRAYRMAYVEAGHLSQTFQLLATALGLNTWLTGALSDAQVEAQLGLQEASAEQALFFVGCGHGDGQAQCQELRALIAAQDAP